MSCSIGVFAGMGPRSTAPFIDMLVSACQSLYAAKDDMDFPKMHIISLPTPFYPGRDIDDRKMASALIACTDISPLMDEGTKPFIMVDTAEGLAQAAIVQYLGIKAERGDDSDRSPA